MHHNFAWSLNLLKTIERHIVQIASTVQVSLLVSHDLLKEDITTGLSLLFLKQQIISGGNLIVLVVLNVSYGLTQIAIWADARCCKAVLYFAQVFIEDRDPILTDHNTLHFCRFNLLIPIMAPNFLHSVPFTWVSIKYFPYEIFTSF